MQRSTHGFWLRFCPTEACGPQFPQSQNQQYTASFSDDSTWPQEEKWKVSPVINSKDLG